MGDLELGLIRVADYDGAAWVIRGLVGSIKRLVEASMRQVWALKILDRASKS